MGYSPLGSKESDIATEHARTHKVSRMGFLLLLFLEVIANKFIEGFTNFLNHHCVANLHFSFGIKFSLCLSMYQGIICYLFIFDCTGFSLFCISFSLVAESGGYSVAAVPRLLIAVASLVEHRL